MSGRAPGTQVVAPVHHHAITNNDVIISDLENEELRRRPIVRTTVRLHTVGY